LGCSISNSSTADDRGEWCCLVSVPDETKEACKLSVS